MLEIQGRVIQLLSIDGIFQIDIHGRLNCRNALIGSRFTNLPLFEQRYRGKQINQRS